MTDTIAFHKANAEGIFLDAADVDLSDPNRQFLMVTPAGGLVLETGYRFDRDSAPLLTRQYRVRPFDPSPQLARVAFELIGKAVSTQTFSVVSEVACYDGTWVCASLQHLPQSVLLKALGQLWAAVKPADSGVHLLEPRTPSHFKLPGKVVEVVGPSLDVKPVLNQKADHSCLEYQKSQKADSALHPCKK